MTAGEKTRGGTLHTILIALAVTALVFVVVAMLAVGWLGWKLELKETPICTSSSPDGQYTVQVVAYGEPIFFSPERVGIRAGGRNDAISTEVANDGGRAYESNFSFTWNGPVVTIVVDGEEQYPETYRITFYGQGDYSAVKIEDAT